jgi:hypothetical protein
MPLVLVPVPFLSYTVFTGVAAPNTNERIIFMIDLSKKQYKMLCKIKRNGSIEKSSLSDNELTICQYLLTKDCLLASYQTVPNFNKIQSIKKLPPQIMLNQTGEAQIYAFRSTFYKWWIPVVISFISLLISITMPIIQVLL